MVSEALAASLIACFQINVTAIDSFKPDIIVGSSFGGAVCQLLLQQGVWVGPTLLLAPALRRVVDLIDMPTRQQYGDVLQMNNIPKPVASATNLQKPAFKIRIIHGSQDKTIPVQDSLNFVSQQLSDDAKQKNKNGSKLWMSEDTIQLTVIEGEGHRLRSTFGEMKQEIISLTGRRDKASTSEA